MDPEVRMDGLYFLKRHPLFGPLGDDVLAELISYLEPLHLDKGQQVVQEGGSGDKLFLLRNGHVHVSQSNQSSNGASLAHLSRGDSIGELAILTGEPHHYSVTTDTACDFLTLTKKEFDRVLEAHPLVGIHLSRALSRRLAVSFHPPSQRPKDPQLLTLVPLLSHETTILLTLNLALAVADQTRRKTLVLDLSWRSGDCARALGLQTEALQTITQTETLHNMELLRKRISTHPSGLDVLSLNAIQIKNQLLSSVPALLSTVKDQYDLVLVLTSPEKDPLLEVLIHESDKTLIISSDRDPMPEEVPEHFVDHIRTLDPLTLWTVRLHHPSVLVQDHYDFLIPWTEVLHQPFRQKGSPYLTQPEASKTIRALERVARAIGKMRIGLAMGSGAAYGYTLVGLLQVFEREKIPIDLVSGCSMGALLGSFFAAGKSPEEIRQTCKQITKRWLFENIIGDLTIPHSGLLAGETLRSFLKTIIGDIQFHQLPIPFATIATDIRSGHEVVLKEGSVVDAVRASTSLPILFCPFLRHGRYLVDGGLVNPVPTSIIANMGADILISVNLTAKPAMRRGLGRIRRAFPLAPTSPNLSEVLVKTIYTMQYEIAQSRTEIAHVVIAPDVRDYTWSDFHKSEEILKHGEVAAEEALGKIKSLLPSFSKTL